MSAPYSEPAGSRFRFWWYGWKSREWYVKRGACRVIVALGPVSLVWRRKALRDLDECRDFDFDRIVGAIRQVEAGAIVGPAPPTKEEP